MGEPFVGRADELNFLAKQLDQAAAGQGRLVLLAGPPGIGKTTLTRQFLASTGARSISASGDAEEAQLAGGLLEQLASAAAPAGQALTGLVRTGRPDALSAGSALLDMLGVLAAGRPLTVVVDDAHWGDELSMKALSFAVRRLGHDRILWMIATRADEMAGLPPGLLRAVGDHGARLDLGGLSAEHIGQLADRLGAGRLPRRAAERLAQHTGGVPLHIKELLYDLPAEVLRNPGATLPAPRSLETLVLSRLAGCTTQTESLVVAAAILGTECRLADAATLAGLDNPLLALQEAVQQRLLIEVDTVSGRCCAFAHALIRTAVYRDIGADRRAALHLVAAGLVGGPAALAHRVAACHGPDGALAADLSAQARADLAAGNPAEAVEHLLAAVQAGGRGAGHEQRLLTAIAQLLDLGDVARARGYTSEIMQLPPSGPRSLALGRLAMFSGDYDSAQQWLTEAWTGPAAEAAPAQERAVAACEFAIMLLGHHRTGEATQWAVRAAGSAATGFTRACSHSVLGLCHTYAGQLDQAVTLLRTELARCADPCSAVMMRIGLGVVRLLSDGAQEAAELLAAGATPEVPAGLPLHEQLYARQFKVLADYRRGAWDEASAGAERLVALAHDLDQGWLLCRAHAVAVYTCAGRGQWDLAQDHVAAVARYALPGSPGDLIELANVRAALGVARDEPESVLAAVGDLADRTGELARLEPATLGFWPSHAWALARTGRLADAEAALRPYEAAARQRGRRSALAAAARIRGQLAAARGQREAAQACFAESASQLTGLGMPFEEALTRLEYGRMLRRAGQRRAASRELAAARATFAALGARPFLAQCDTEASHQPAVTASGRLPLTPRQLAVATAVAAGKTNRQVAHDLYISIKTVEFHISQILTRLGIDSRGDIAAVLAGGHGQVSAGAAAAG